MKKLWLLILCLVMLATSALAAGENVLPRDILGEDTYAYPSSIVGMNGTMYALLDSSDGVFLAWWQEGMDVAEVASTALAQGRYLNPTDEIAEEQKYAVTTLFTDGERLMSLNPVTGLVFAMDVVDDMVQFTDVVTLKDVSGLMIQNEDYAYLRNVIASVAVDGRLYQLTRDWDNSGKELLALTAFDLTTGECENVPVEHVIALTAYKDGKLLAMVHDSANSWDEKTQTMIPPSLAVMDPATGTMDTVAQMPGQLGDRMVYSEALDAMIYFDNGRIMGMAGLTEKRQFGYAPLNWPEYMVMLDGDTVALGGNEGVVIRDLKADFATDQYLNIYGSWLDEGTRLFTEENPDVPVYFSSEYYDTVEKLNQAMVSGEDALDLLQMGVAYTSFLTLRDKGYCADLSGDAELMAMAERLHPVFRDALMKDGKLYAIPVNAYSSGWGCNLEVLEGLDMDIEDVPTDYISLCEFVTEWNDNLMYDYPEYSLFGGVYNTREYLLGIMMDTYMYWCNANGGDVSFNTPEFRQMMTALENMHCEEMDRVYLQDERSGEVYRMGLLEYGYPVVGDFGWMMENYDLYTKIIKMKMTPDTPFFMPVNLEVMFINPRSEHKELAVELLKCRLEGLNDTDRYVFFADATEPVENPYYQQAMKEYQQYIDLYTEKLASADEAERDIYEGALESYRDMMAEQENYRYSISAEAIETYQQELVHQIILATPTLYNSQQNTGSSELTTLMNRYRDKQIDLEQFIREADSKLWMMRMENQ